MNFLMQCKVCSDRADFFARDVILGKYSISYYRCNACGFIQTEEPYWLDEVYSKAIAGSDTGLVSRNLDLAIKAQAIISTWFNPAKKFLDFAGGYGMMVRLMRDAGYDFRWHDKYCDNIFAKGFEADVTDQGEFELVTAFEVFEHMSDPLTQIKSLEQYSRNILFSTEIIPEAVPQPGSWDYYGLDHGQHLSFFSLKSLEVISKKLSLHLYTNGTSIHLFTEKKLPSSLFKIITYNLPAILLRILFRRNSLLVDDHSKTLQLRVDSFKGK